MLQISVKSLAATASTQKHTHNLHYGLFLLAHEPRCYQTYSPCWFWNLVDTVLVVLLQTMIRIIGLLLTSDDNSLTTGKNLTQTGRCVVYFDPLQNCQGLCILYSAETQLCMQLILFSNIYARGACFPFPRLHHAIRMETVSMLYWFWIMDPSSCC
jgi:hypothetical protein